MELTDPRLTGLKERVLHVDGTEGFNALAVDLFRIHAENNPVYRGFLHGLGLSADSVSCVEDIPFLPIQLFRNHRVLIEGLDATLTFTSSGTTGGTTSSHHLPWPELYERSFLGSFRNFYGEPEGMSIVALLPSYLEREGSSLVYMVKELIARSKSPFSGTFLYRYAELAEALQRSGTDGRRTLLIGIPYALLEFAERHPMPLINTTVMETGGMKGRRPELVREALHAILRKALGVEVVHSEYGMTELLSQAWSRGNGIFHCPPWMRVMIRDVNDPLEALPTGRSGGINVIDLANVASCPFIATQDLGRSHADGSFEVLGRFDHSDIRGCNLMMEL